MSASLLITSLGYVLMAVSVYYGVLYLLSLIPRQHLARHAGPKPFMLLVVPAHNEDMVIRETLESLVTLDYDDYLVLVINDGSTDDTSRRAREFEPGGRVMVVDRPAEVAGRGKGAVLNHAFAVLNELVDAGDPRLAGTPPDRIVIGVMDADGQLERHALGEVAPYFADPRVGGVQIGVRIVNATGSLLARFQDIEFVGFSQFVQVARDRVGSVGLGGNGQFTRLSALRSLGRDPWTDCLTEDLDLCLSLVENGWRMRFCRHAFVAQQGLHGLRPLLRQRARWTQGHYQCWRHMPALIRAHKVSRLTRFDLCVYLSFVTFVMLVLLNTLVGIASLFGWIDVNNLYLVFLPAGIAKNLLIETVSIGPIVAFLATYQAYGKSRLKWWEVPAYGAMFSVYAYLWAAATIWAWYRMALRREGWAKTARVRAEAAV